MPVGGPKERSDFLWHAPGAVKAKPPRGDFSFPACLESSREMENFSPDAWIAILVAVATLIIGGAGAIISVLLGVLTWLAKVFFDYASAMLAELPVIKEKLTDQHYARKADRMDIDSNKKEIDRAHERIDGHEVEITNIKGVLSTDTKSN